MSHNLPIRTSLICDAYIVGMVATAARTLLESLDRIPNEDNRTRISVIAVDSNLHFFFMPPGASEPSMLVVGDLDDVFLPKPADLLVNLSEARASLENLLSRLSDMFKENHDVGNSMSSALQAAYKLVASLPSQALSNDDSSLIGILTSRLLEARLLFCPLRYLPLALERSKTEKTRRCLAQQKSLLSYRLPIAGTKPLLSIVPGRKFLWTCGCLLRAIQMLQP